MLSSLRALTVLVIGHNAASTIGATVDRVYRALTVTVEEFDVVIYDDGSTDDTVTVAEAICRKYPFVTLQRNDRRRGPGYCIIEGGMRAEKPFVVYIPGDNTWPLRSYIELFGHIGKADVVTSYSTNLLAAMPLPKRLVSAAYTGILNFLFRKGIHYYNGLTIYPVEYLRQGPIDSYGFGFQAEALIKAVSAGYSFIEIALPVDTENLSRSRSVTPANIVNAVFTILRLLVEVRLLKRARFLRPSQQSAIAGGPTAEELGIDETAAHPAYRRSAGLRAPLRIVVTGASSGIGATLAKALATDGHRLFICARRSDRLAAVLGNASGHRTQVCDVSDERQVADFTAAIAGDTDAIDVLINCAGGFGEIGPVAITDSQRWLHTIEVNLFGSYLVTRHLLPLLAKGKFPRIINFAGGGAFSSYPNYSAYACSKAALVRLTECLADELLAQGIRVNAVAPGFVPTDMHQATLAAGEERAGRLQYQRTQAILSQGGASMESVVDCVRLLLSPGMDGLTGKTISSNFDPWQTPAFQDFIGEITRSDLYTMRRINVVNLPDGHLRTTLSQPWASAASEN